MRQSELVDYLDNDPFLEKAPRPTPKRSAQTERDKEVSDLVKMVKEIISVHAMDVNGLTIRSTA